MKKDFSHEEREAGEANAFVFFAPFARHFYFAKSISPA